MRTNAKFKHTNFLKRDRYQAKINAVLTIAKTRYPMVLNVNFVGCGPSLIPFEVCVEYSDEAFNKYFED